MCCVCVFFVKNKTVNEISKWDIFFFYTTYYTFQSYKRIELWRSQWICRRNSILVAVNSQQYWHVPITRTHPHPHINRKQKREKKKQKISPNFTQLYESIDSALIFMNERCQININSTPHCSLYNGFFVLTGSNNFWWFDFLLH